MPRRCCVPRCTSNYDSCKNDGLVSTFSFPNEENLRQSWVRAIPRKYWTPSRSSVVCAKHFVPTDIIRTAFMNSDLLKNYDELSLKIDTLIT